jgi:hypothetical protein
METMVRGGGWGFDAVVGLTATDLLEGPSDVVDTGTTLGESGPTVLHPCMRQQKRRRGDGRRNSFLKISKNASL